MSEQLNSVLSSITIKAIVKSSLDHQRELWNIGESDNSGASIDVLQVMLTTLTGFDHLNKTQVLLLNSLQEVDELKYSKQLHRKAASEIRSFVARLK